MTLPWRRTAWRPPPGAVAIALAVAALPSPAVAERAAPAPEAAAPAVPAAPPLPDPARWHQEPPRVLEDTRPDTVLPPLELGLGVGLASRPATGATGERVHYDAGWVFGAHARVDLCRWLGARLQARFEGGSASFDDGALGLASGTTYGPQAFHRVTLGAAVEPTWTPLARLDLWVGLGAAWGRTTADSLHTSGAESIALPTRAAVFVEFPASLGVRFHAVPGRLVLNLSGQLSVLTDQSGSLQAPYRTPDASGRLVTVEAFPALGASLAALAGVGILL